MPEFHQHSRRDFDYFGDDGMNDGNEEDAQAPSTPPEQGGDEARAQGETRPQAQGWPHWLDIQQAAAFEARQREGRIVRLMLAIMEAADHVSPSQARIIAKAVEEVA